MTNKNLLNNLIFFGSSSFGLLTIELLLENHYQISLVITLPDEPAGRNRKFQPTPVKIFCLKNNLSFIQPEKLKDQEIIKKIKDLDPNLAVVASYGKIIPQEILNIFTLGCLNLHPSLLPKYRGPSPIQTAILNGDQETGVTIIKLDEKMDHGPIVANRQWPIANGQTFSGLHEQLSREAAELLIKTLPDYLAKKIKPLTQDDNQATYTKIFTKENGRIDWQKEATAIERQIRAFFPWPGSYAEFKIKNKNLLIKILTAQSEKNIEAKPALIGQIQQKNGQLFVQCGQGALEILKLQPEGKNEMAAKDFINGYFKSDSAPLPPNLGGK